MRALPRIATLLCVSLLLTSGTGRLYANMLALLEADKSTRKKYTFKKTQIFAEMLSPATIAALADPRIGPVLYRVLTHPKFTVPLPLVLDFSRIVEAGSLDLRTYGKYLAKLASYQLPPLEIARRGVERQAYEHWARTRVMEVEVEDPRAFVSTVRAIPLDEDYKTRLINTYGLCIDSYRHPDNHRYMRKVSVEKPLYNFGHAPQEEELPPRRILQEKTPLERAYATLVRAAKNAVTEHALNEWQQACLAKCIGDELVEYSSASRHPLRAISLLISSMVDGGAKTLSNKYGICTTYARITEAIGQELGFGGRMRMGHKGKHFFNQVKIEGRWYHFHPLRKYGKDCSFFPYS